MDYTGVFEVITDCVKICFPIAFVVNMLQLLINMVFSAAFGGKMKVSVR